MQLLETNRYLNQICLFFPEVCFYQRPKTPKDGPTATAQRVPDGRPVAPVLVASFRPRPSTDADTGTDKLMGGLVALARQVAS